MVFRFLSLSLLFSPFLHPPRKSFAGVPSENIKDTAQRRVTARKQEEAEKCDFNDD